MYRQIWIDEGDVNFQKIVWSFDDNRVPQHYQLLTVTYGTSCAPYWALLTIQQLCKNEEQA